MGGSEVSRTGLKVDPQWVRFDRLPDGARAADLEPLDGVGGRTPHGDALGRALRPQISDVRLADPLNANVRGLAPRRRLRTLDHLTFAALIREPVTEFEIHRQDTHLRGSLLLGR